VGSSSFDSGDATDVVEDGSDGPVLRLRVRPRSSRRGVLGTNAGTLAVGVAAAPEGGKATAEAMKVVASWLGVAPSRLGLISGATSRSKRVLVSGETAGSLRRLVAERLAAGAGKRGERKLRNPP
jgi:uncharacterized protein YggU (UPF0235/DUF167 family)